MRRLATLSLNNRSFIALVCAVIAVIGVLAVTTLRQELIPSVSLPQIQIVTTSPGASTEQVESRLSSPIEQSVRGLENVEKTSSKSSPNVSMVTVELKYGTDVSRSANQVDAAISRIKDDLPDGADPQVISGGSSDIPASVISISSDDKPAVLAEHLRSSVIPDLERVDGVSSVMLAGAPTDIVRITPNSSALERNGLTVDDIQKAIDDDGLSLPGGQVSDDKRTLDVTVGQDYDSIDDLKGVIVQPSDQGQQGQQQLGQQPAAPVTLGSIAKIEQTQEDATSISRTDGRESLVLIVTATADGNLVDVSKGVQKTLDSGLAGVGGHAKSDVVFDQAPFIQESITSLAEEGLLGLLFAVGVILLFLRAVRPTIVTAISIPMSLLMAFIGMLVSGYTLNMLTLAALTISIGRVVDDSIVVIENIMRHLSYGTPRRQAIVTAVGEVAGAVTSSTLATVIVFLPVAVVSGMAGELFRPFSLTVAIAMLSSLFVSLTIVPVLAYWFLRAPKRARELAAEGGTPEQVAERVRTDAEAQEKKSWLHRIYAPVLRWTQAHRLITVALALIVLVGTAFLTPLMKVNFLGDTGQNMASFTQTLPPGTTLDDSAKKAAEAEKALKDVKGVKTVQTTIGASAFGPMGGGGATNEVSYAITTDADEDQEAVRADILKTIQSQKDAGDVQEEQQAGPTGGSTIDIQITGPSSKARAEANSILMERLGSKPKGVEKVTSDLEADQPTAVVSVDRKKAAQLGLSEKAVVGLVAKELSPSSIGTVTLGDRDLDIYLEDGKAITTLSQLKAMKIAGMPLTDIASVKEQDSRPQIITQDTQETVTVSLTPSGDDTREATKAAENAIDKGGLPDGVKASIGGAAEDINDAFGQLGIAMVAAVLLTYVLLVWIFKSLIQPLILLVSIPFAATGAFGLLILTGVPLGLPSMIGLLMLVGIVVTNAIVLIDLVNQYRRQGMRLDAAIAEGASHRLRPILMTAAATIFALLPMAFGITGKGGFISQPLAVVVIGGLVTSTLLTLVIVPVLYRLAEGRGEKKRLAAAAAGVDADADPDGLSARRGTADGAGAPLGDGAAADGAGASAEAGVDPETGHRTGHGRRRKPGPAQ